VTVFQFGGGGNYKPGVRELESKHDIAITSGLINSIPGACACATVTTNIHSQLAKSINPLPIKSIKALRPVEL